MLNLFNDLGLMLKKQMRSSILIGQRILRVAIVSLAVLCCVSCTDNKSLPKELQLTRILYQEKEQHIFGPGGLNQSFYVYEISEKLTNKVQSDGIEYLNLLDSSKKADAEKKDIYQRKIIEKHIGPYEVGFSNWRITPVSKSEEWFRHGRDLGKDWKPSITTFFAGWKGDKTNDEFISKISPDFLNSFHKAISMPGNVYAFGGYRNMCILVVAPSQRRAYYVYRD